MRFNILDDSGFASAHTLGYTIKIDMIYPSKIL